jgi:hypothetical protein
VIPASLSSVKPDYPVDPETPELQRPLESLVLARAGSDDFEEIILVDDLAPSIARSEKEVSREIPGPVHGSPAPEDQELTQPPSAAAKVTGSGNSMAETGSGNSMPETGSVRGVAETRSVHVVAETGSVRGLAETRSVRGVAETGSARGVAETGSSLGVAETDVGRTSDQLIKLFSPALAPGSADKTLEPKIVALSGLLDLSKPGVYVPM